MPKRRGRLHMRSNCQVTIGMAKLMSTQVSSKYKWTTWLLKLISNYRLMLFCLVGNTVPKNWHIYVIFKVIKRHEWRFSLVLQVMISKIAHVMIQNWLKSKIDFSKYLVTISLLRGGAQSRMNKPKNTKPSFAKKYIFPINLTKQFPKS